MPGEMGKRMFFVIGAPRSGTTLLMRMLNVHPDIATRPEPHLLTPLAHLGYYAYVDKAPYDPFQAATASQAFVRDLPGGEQDYLDALRGYSDTLYGRMLEGMGGRRYFLDKTPAYGLILPFLAKLYPDAMYVVITRHPFAIFSSYAQSFFDDDWEAAHRFNPILERYIPALSKFLRERPVGRLVHVRYEQLVSDPERTLEAICAAAEIPFHADMVRYGEKAMAAEGLGDPTGVGAHDRPNTGSLEKWGRSLGGRPERVRLLLQTVAHLSDEELSYFGVDHASLSAALQRHAEGKAVASKRSWDRYALERRALLMLRRNIHHSALGRALRKARFVLDVLLRE
jgi:hypothetical protein